MIDDEDWTPTPPADPADSAAEPAGRRGRPAWAQNPRAVRRHRCPRCATWLWSALDADLLAMEVTVDAGVFLSAAGEARALERGRRTWDYFTVPSRRIEVRYEDHRATWPAGEPGRDGRTALVLVEHVHGRPAPAWGRYSPPRKRSGRRQSDKPPF